MEILPFPLGPVRRFSAAFYCRLPTFYYKLLSRIMQPPAPLLGGEKPAFFSLFPRAETGRSTGTHWEGPTATSGPFDPSTKSRRPLFPLHRVRPSSAQRTWENTWTPSPALCSAVTCRPIAATCFCTSVSGKKPSPPRSSHNPASRPLSGRRRRATLSHTAKLAPCAPGFWVAF